MKEYLAKVIKRWKVSSVVLLLPIFMFFILGPTEIFYASYSDFDFEVKHFIWLFTGIAVVLWLVGSIIMSLFNDKVNAIFNAIVFACSVAFYIQNMFLNVKLAGFAGSSMDWEELKGYTAVNTVIWLVMLVAFFCIAFLIKKYRDKICLGVSAFLIAVQAVAFVSLLVTLSGDVYKSSHYKLSPATEFELANEENVIILLLDATSERFFQEQIKESPEILTGLEDFTYYTNYEPCYMTTCPAVTYLWTNHTPDCTVNRLQWLKDAWKTDRATDFFNRIHEKGYECRFYTNHQGVVFGDAENLLGCVDNVAIMDAQVNTWLMFSMLEKYTVYRYVPYVMKPRFEVNPEHFRGVTTYFEEFDHCEPMIDFYEHIQASPMKTDKELSKLVYYHHFDGIHSPWRIDENGNRFETDSGDEAFTKIVTRGDFVAVKYFLNQLKELGIYDNSTIIISADHGNIGDHTDLQCIFFLKQKGETHDEIQYNHAPISADDFQASILYFIGDEEYSDFGTTYFDWQPGDSRDRYSMIRDLGGKDGFYGYLYNGDGEDLYETIMDGIDAEIVNVGGWCQ